MRAIAFAAWAALFTAGMNEARAGEHETALALRKYFENSPKHALRSVYERMSFLPYWSGSNERGQAAAELFRIIANADAIGIDPDEYPLEKIRRLANAADLREGFAPSELAALDLALTDTFLQFAADQMYGRVSSSGLDRRRIKAPEREYVANILVGAAARNDPAAALRVIVPFAPDYRVLAAELTRHREVAARGGWPKVSKAILGIKPGHSDPSVAELRLRLIAGGDLEAKNATVAGALFDEDLQRAVERFQLRHGLHPDGHVGRGTLHALNISAAYRARQLELNLERRRWVGRGLGEKYILVNIPTFTLRAVQDCRTEIITRVIVGKKKNETPFVSTQVTAIELNPDWNVPKNIKNNEVIPEAKKDPAWLTERGIRVLYGKGDDAVEVDPTTVDWSAAGGEDYRFLQPPGPGNALGQLKLVTPNPLNIYLHDTPQRGLFKREVRAFSHGCVRVEDPMQLAAWVLDDPEWTEPSLAREMNTTDSLTLKVANPPEVHLVYWTAWADSDGVLRFAPDIYGWDEKLARALNKLPRYIPDDVSHIVSVR